MYSQPKYNACPCIARNKGWEEMYPVYEMSRWERTRLKRLRTRRKRISRREKGSGVLYDE